MEDIVPIRKNRTLYILVGAVLLSIITISGWGGSMKLNEILSFSFIIAAMNFYYRHRDDVIPTGRIVGFIILICCLSEIMNVMINNLEMYKIFNYTSLFGLIIGGSMAAEIKWEECISVKIGCILCAVAIMIIFLFLPGNFLHGWNPNSSIYAIPGLLLGLTVIYISEEPMRVKLFCFYGFVGLGFFVIHELQNRSSLMALLLMAIVPICKPIWTKRKWFRLFYISLLVMSALIPLFQDAVANSDLFKEILHLSQGTVDKGEGFNGRELVWHKAAEIIDQNPLFGTGGWRKIYFHNFSLDVLTQYGWIGWLTFAGMVMIVMERCFVSGAYTNVFLFAFAALFAMNTYENALFANNFFVIYPYLLIGAAWRFVREEDTNECTE